MDLLRWRLMEKEGLDPYTAMALEEVALESVTAGKDPLVHFWTWTGRAVTLGSFQMASDEIYPGRCRIDKVPVIRRISGGGTMFHTPDQEIVYSICAPPGEIDRDITRSYVQLLGPLVRGLKGIGIDTYVDENNLMVDDKKISGSSQRRLVKAILHHGTVLHDVNSYEMFSYIKGDNVVPSGKGTCSNYKPVTCVLDHVRISMEDLYRAVKTGIMEGKDHYISKWTEEELERARELVEKKYSKDDWNL